MEYMQAISRRPSRSCPTRSRCLCPKPTCAGRGRPERSAARIPEGETGRTEPTERFRLAPLIGARAGRAKLHKICCDKTGLIGARDPRCVHLKSESPL